MATLQQLQRARLVVILLYIANWVLFAVWANVAFSLPALIINAVIFVVISIALGVLSYKIRRRFLQELAARGGVAVVRGPVLVVPARSAAAGPQGYVSHAPPPAGFAAAGDPPPPYSAAGAAPPPYAESAVWHTGKPVPYGAPPPQSGAGVWDADQRMSTFNENNYWNAGRAEERPVASAPPAPSRW